MALVINLASGTPQVGLWCPDCLTPGVVEVPVYSLRDDVPYRFATWRYCDDCGKGLTT